MILFFLSVLPVSIFSQSVPYLRKQGTATQMMVDGKPFLMLGGELGNSSAADPGNIKAVFPLLKEMKLNTVLAPVYWELLEPEEGRFDFGLVDVLIREARKEELKLVLLWFGSWKNSMSCYAPSWIKTNPERFPYVQVSDGRSVEIMTAFSDENLNADKKAFVALMDYLKKTDSEAHTVIMVQVENEIGMIPEPRERTAEADRLFAGDVPAGLTAYLRNNRKTLQPYLLNRWASSDHAVKGNWESVFGKGICTEEIFQAWHYARYANEIAKAGKSAYNLPMFVNAALNTRNRQPGAYPSAGPLPHLLDIWRAAAPDIDFLAPDIYDPPFDYWCRKYDISGNPLFIPETQRGDHTSARVFYAFGAHNAMGFCPFSIESTSDPKAAPLVRSYGILHQMSDLITSVQGQDKTAGCWLHPAQLRDTLTMGKYTFIVSHDYTLGWSPGAKEEQGKWPEAGCMIIQMGTDDFLVAGTGVVIRCFSRQPGKTFAGILSCDKGLFEDGAWKPFQRLNGDETHQGRHIRIPVGEYDMQRFKLYEYR